MRESAPFAGLPGDQFALSTALPRPSLGAVDNQFGAPPVKALQPLRQALGIELLTWVPAPADAPAALLGLAQADRRWDRSRSPAFAPGFWALRSYPQPLRLARPSPATVAECACCVQNNGNRQLSFDRLALQLVQRSSLFSTSNPALLSAC
jgi:hypothetical protein